MHNNYHNVFKLGKSVLKKLNQNQVAYLQETWHLGNYSRLNTAMNRSKYQSANSGLTLLTDRTSLNACLNPLLIPINGLSPIHSATLMNEGTRLYQVRFGYLKKRSNSGHITSWIGQETV